MIVFFKFFNNPNQSRNLLFNKLCINHHNMEILLNIVKVPCVDLSEDVDMDNDIMFIFFSIGQAYVT